MKLNSFVRIALVVCLLLTVAFVSVGCSPCIDNHDATDPASCSYAAGNQLFASPANGLDTHTYRP